ncbi:beta family protein [Streptomyces sp. NBC_00988]|uniref:beta family protein n=1 Tax=Streptomyces sp. NBC_00988 TaxID=2903704 RepID=UPI0038646EA3|nr:beta family protein [Streptomyces sp. NBC_00988]
MSFQYVPALPVKRGDVQGFRDVAADLAARMAPLWTVPVINLRTGEAPSVRDRVKHLQKAAQQLRQVSGSGRSWIDTRHAEEDPKMVGDALWGEFGLFTAAAPVTGPERPPAQQALAQELADTFSNGLGLRLDLRGLPVTEAAEQVAELAKRSAVAVEAMDLLLDLGAIADAAQAGEYGARAVAELGRLRPWRSVVLLAGSFPASLQQLARDQVTRLPRHEVPVWRAVRENSGLDERLVYGDYSVVHPGKPAQTTTGPVTILGRVLYSDPQDFLVVKGRNMAVYGTAQMPALASRITTDPAFRGRGFSEGERYLADCVAGQESPGLPERWIRAGHTQHLAQTVEQVAR